MTDRVRTSISKVSVTLGLIITIVTLIAGGVTVESRPEIISKELGT